MNTNGSMRILFVLDHLGANGTVTHVLTIAKKLMKAGHHIVVTARNGTLLPAFRELSLTFYEIDFPNEFFHNQPEGLIAKSELRKITLQEKITHVHAHQTYSGYIAALCMKELNIPFFYTVHGLYTPLLELNKVLNHARTAISVSPIVFEKLKNVCPCPIYLVENGIDLEQDKLPPQHDIRTTLKLKQNDFTIFYASRLEWKKADICLKMLQAASMLKRSEIPSLQVVIAGEGNRSGQIADTAFAYNLKFARPYIQLIGSKQNLNEYYKIADCVVGTGRTAIEAMICGKPVIAAGNEGFIGLITENNWQNVHYLHYGDHGASKSVTKQLFSSTILEVFQKRNQDLKALTTHMKNYYDIDKNLHKLLQVYKN